MVGFMDNSIWIAFAGSKYSFGLNDEFEFSLIPYDAWPECIDCKVTNGVYSSALYVFDDIVTLIKELEA